MTTSFVIMKDCISSQFKEESKIRVEGKRAEDTFDVYSMDSEKETKSNWSES